MANKDWAYGLQPLRTIGGAAPQTTRWPLKQKITSTKYGTVIYKGQLLLFSNSGWALANGITNPGAFGGVLGVAAEYYAGSVINATKTEIMAWDAIEHIFSIQSDNATTTLGLADVIQKSFPVSSPTAGSTISGLSGMEMDYSLGTTASTAGVYRLLRCIGLTNEIGEGEGANMKCVVRVNFGHSYEENRTSPQ